jgi:hypothetical protein
VYFFNDERDERIPLSFDLDIEGKGAYSVSRELFPFQYLPAMQIYDIELYTVLLRRCLFFSCAAVY